jgi:regulator of protease activity HflC (stomatin/prohibitin superfamily)
METSTKPVGAGGEEAELTARLDRPNPEQKIRLLTCGPLGVESPARHRVSSFTKIDRDQQRVPRSPEPPQTAGAEDYEIRLVIQQLSHVCGKDTWPAIGAGFIPVPGSPAARPQLGIAQPAELLDVDKAPAGVDHTGRRLVHTPRLGRQRLAYAAQRLTDSARRDPVLTGAVHLGAACRSSVRQATASRIRTQLGVARCGASVPNGYCGKPARAQPESPLLTRKSRPTGRIRAGRDLTLWVRRAGWLASAIDAADSNHAGAACWSYDELRTFADVEVSMTALIIVLVVLALVAIVFASSARVVQQFERGVLFRLGRVQQPVRAPGLNMIVPIVDHLEKVSMQIVTMPVPAQEGITRDNVTVKVDAVVYFRVHDPVRAIVEVQDYQFAVLQVAQTSLRSIIGKSELDDLLSNREPLNQGLALMIDSPAVGWGVEIDRVEIKDVELPDSMKRSMSRQAEAERERRSRIITADGEFQASQKLALAAAAMADTPSALQLRLLQTIVEVAAEKNSTVVLPFPVELLRFLEQAAGPVERSSGSVKGADESKPATGTPTDAAITDGSELPPPAKTETLKATPTAPA